MKFLKISPLLLSCLLLTAHFFRADLIFLVICTMGLPFLLRIGQPWAIRLIQFCLVLGAGEWLRTLFIFASQRQELHQPWIRLAVIMGGVALFTGLSALPLSSFIKKQKSAGLL